MKNTVVSPEFKIRVYRYGYKAFEEFPSDWVSNISSTRSLKGNSIVITIPERYQEARKVFQDHAVVQLLIRLKEEDGFLQENLGYVHQVSYSDMAAGQKSTTVQIMGFDVKLQMMNFFLDLQDEQTQGIRTLSEYKSSFEGSFSQYSKVLKEAKQLKTLIESIYKNLIRDLVNPSKRFLFGGKTLFADLREEPDFNQSFIYPAISAYSYTGNILLVFNFMSQFGIGNSVNFWQLVYSMVTEPLYELYFDPLQEPVKDGIPSFTNIGDSTINSPENGCLLVFRPTPFEELFDLEGKWFSYDSFEKIPEHLIKRKSFTSDTGRVVSGIHVGMSLFEQSANTLVFRPKWNNIIKSRYGYNLLQVRLEGVSLKDKELPEIKGSWQEKVFNIRNRLYDIFCNEEELKHCQLNIDTPFNFYRVGKGYGIEHEDNYFGNTGYLETVTNTFNPRGMAQSSLSFKWIGSKLYSPNPVETTDLNINDSIGV